MHFTWVLFLYWALCHDVGKQQKIWEFCNEDKGFLSMNFAIKTKGFYGWILQWRQRVFMDEFWCWRLKKLVCSQPGQRGLRKVPEAPRAGSPSPDLVVSLKGGYSEFHTQPPVDSSRSQLSVSGRNWCWCQLLHWHRLELTLAAILFQ